jgi:hypothetical protein
MSRHIVTTLVLLAAFGAGVPEAAASSSPVRLSFDKSASIVGEWEGIVTGDVNGALRTVLLSRKVTGSIWLVEFDWVVTAGESSFVARLSGTLNTATGAVVMNGAVTSGFLLGARVHEEGQLVDAGASRFVGTITIATASGA